ncbi:MAG: DJ-1/PfpI family protein [Patescibacteria group bacterium]|nr:DJ-1/PfpI family protein [Patescibacteria group bacterium]
MHNHQTILIVLPLENFRDEEYEVSKNVFQKSGFQIKTASLSQGEAIGKMGTRIRIDYAFSEIHLNDYVAVVFVGGSGTVQFLNNPEALNLARDFSSAGKLVAAICWAPQILANAGLLQGKKATVTPEEEEALKAKGAIYTGNPVEIDDSIITANGPKAALEFAEKIVKFLS